MAGIFITVAELMNGLLDPGSLNEHKNKRGRRLTFIGYDFDLNTQRVSIARKNVLTCLYGFMLLSENTGTVSVKTLERLASWASRYSTVCVLIRPFVGWLYAAQAGQRRNVHVPLTEDLLRVCRLIQIMVVLSVVDENRFARSFMSFDASRLPIRVMLGIRRVANRRRRSHILGRCSRSRESLRGVHYRPFSIAVGRVA